MDWGKEYDKETAEHFEKLEISLQQRGCNEAGPNLVKADHQTGGPAPAAGSTLGGPHIIFPGGERDRFGNISWESNLQHRRAFGGR
jgi:hypothetical protein